MDTIFYNGRVYTMEPGWAPQSAVAVQDGIIQRVGSDEEILSLKTEQNEHQSNSSHCSPSMHEYNHSCQKQNILWYIFSYPILSYPSSQGHL